MSDTFAVPLPHAPPFRLLDRVLSADLERGQLLAVRQLTLGDALWPAEAHGAQRGALPAAAVAFPEVLIIEALCQAAACLNGLELGRRSGAAAVAHLGYLVAVSDFRFPQSVDSPDFPAKEQACSRVAAGNTLLLWVERQGTLGALSSFFARASVPMQKSPGSSADAGPGPGDLFGPAREVAAGRLLFAINPK